MPRKRCWGLQEGWDTAPHAGSPQAGLGRTDHDIRPSPRRVTGAQGLRGTKLVCDVWGQNQRRLPGGGAGLSGGLQGEDLARAGGHSRQQASRSEDRHSAPPALPCAHMQGDQRARHTHRGSKPELPQPHSHLGSGGRLWGPHCVCRAGQGPHPRSLSTTCHSLPGLAMLGPRGALGKSFPFLTSIPSRAQRGK